MNPCETCPIIDKCGTPQGCYKWRTWFLHEWKKFNNYALAHGLEIEELKQDD